MLFMMRKLAGRAPVIRSTPFKIYNYVVIPTHFPLFPYHLRNYVNLRGRSYFIIGVRSQSLVINFCRGSKSILSLIR